MIRDIEIKIMSALIKYSPINQSSEKAFGVVFSIIFLIVALYPLINSKNLHIWALVVSIVFFLLAFLAPKTLVLPNKIWFKFGLLIGSFVAPIVMTLVYFFTDKFIDFRFSQNY